MIKINKKIISTDTEVILETLKTYILTRDGRNILKDIKPTDDNIMVTCPFHKDGNERKPSCGISTVDKEDHPAGTVHCFTCGYVSSFDSFISKLMNFDDGGEAGRNWLLENFETSYTREINTKLSRDKEKIDNQYVNESLLEQYRWYHPYMYKRGLTNEIIERYDIGYDKINDMITFPVRDIKGKCLFLAKRSVKGKMFILPSNRNKPLYGVYELDYNKSDIFICESFFNALTLAKWGHNAVAMMGTGSSYQYELLNKLPFRVYHLCLDGDLAGRLGNKKLNENIRKDKIVYEHLMPDGKDVNDLSEEQFNTIPYKIRVV